MVSSAFWCKQRLSQATALRHRFETSEDADHYRDHPAPASSRSLASRALLRALLHHQWENGWSRTPVDHTPKGAPFLRSEPECSISVSHSGQLVAVAACEGNSIGIDIERIDLKLSMMSIARKRFHTFETRALASMGRHARPDAFFAWWAAKEAVAKCLRQGLALPMASFFVPNPFGSGPALGLATPVWVIPLPAPAGYRAALAWQGESHSCTRVTQVDAEKISAARFKQL